MGTNQTPDVVAKAKAALEGATAAPWYAVTSEHDEEATVVSEGEWVDGYGFSVAFDLRNGDAEFFAACRALVPELVAELEQWRQMAEDALGVDTPDDVAEYIRLSGLSINLGPYGEWGQETLQALFRDLDPALVDRILGRVQP